MTETNRPVWLKAAVGTLAGLIGLGVVACGSSAFGDVLREAPVAAQLVGLRSDTVHLTSAVPHLTIASVDTIADSLDEADRPAPMNGLCPANMVSVDDRFCVDKYEAGLVEMLPSGEERPFPYYMAVDGHKVRAVSEKGVFPQGYISGREAAQACKASGKRLCKPQEWKTACKGPEKAQWGYGNERRANTCNDHGKSPIGFYFMANIQNGTAYSSPKIMNDPQLNQLEGTLAETGSHDECTNGYGVYDMVGNIHEWVDDPEGTFQGGYYLDVDKNGEGCGYRTDAHNVTYHDYSTGFRCCADIAQ